MRRFSQPLMTLVVLAMVLVLGAPSPVAAQEGNTPGLRITSVDTDAFPMVSLTMDSINLDENLAELPIRVLENGEEVTVDSRGPVELGTQTALVVDASGSFNDAGVTGKPIYEEVRVMVEQLIESGALTPDSDYMQSFAPGATTGEITTIQNWTLDHQAVWNNLYLYQLPPPDAQTPLFDLLFFGLDSFVNSGLQSNSYRSMVLFSDGRVGGSATRLEDAINRAVRERVVIHTVQLGNYGEEATANMRRLAILTGGRYIQMATETDAATIWETIRDERTQLALNFRSQAGNPQELRVSAVLGNGSTLETAVAYPSVAVEPVAVSIDSPADQVVIEKNASAYNTPVTDIEPKEITIEVNFDWPDGFERDITQVEYFVGNTSRVKEQPPFNEFTFPIDTLDSGKYAVRAIATDELGIRGESSPVEFTVNVIRPEAPPPPIPTITIPFVNITLPVERVRTAASIGAVLLAVLALLLAIRSPRVRKPVTEAVGRVVKEVTQPLGIGRRTGLNQPKATLIVLQGDGKLQGSIDLRRANTKFGRSPDQANIVLDDPHVSRYHCRITEENDGSFRIWDEGSTSGTYVNDETVDLKLGHVLKTGDVINIGECIFEFQYKSNDKDSTQSHKRSHVPPPGKDVTEPAVKRS
jgi:hypothetical protein